MLRLDKLKGTANYIAWAADVELVLQALGMAGHLDSAPTPSTAEAAQDKQVRATIILTMDPAVRSGMLVNLTSFDLWAAAKAKYGSPSAYNTAILLSQFYGRFLKDGVDIENFLATKKEQRQLLANAGQQISDEIFVATLLVACRKRFESLVESLVGKTTTPEELEKRLLDAQDWRRRGQRDRCAQRRG